MSLHKCLVLSTFPEISSLLIPGPFLSVNGCQRVGWLPSWSFFWLRGLRFQKLAERIRFRWCPDSSTGLLYFLFWGQWRRHLIAGSFTRAKDIRVIYFRKHFLLGTCGTLKLSTEILWRREVLYLKKRRFVSFLFFRVSFVAFWGSGHLLWLVDPSKSEREKWKDGKSWASRGRRGEGRQGWRTLRGPAPPGKGRLLCDRGGLRGNLIKGRGKGKTSDLGSSEVESTWSC